MSRIRQKRQTSGKEAPYHLRNEHEGSQRYRYSQGADVRMLVDVAVVVMAVVVMAVVVVRMVVMHVRNVTRCRSNED
ncbi:MAG: hypothetical protein ACKOE4_07425 [Candidatus Kapaibacterium sp.]